MAIGRIGDRLSVESERVGEPPRDGVILEVLGAGEGLHYHVRWDGGHESSFYPSGGSISIVPKADKTKKS